MARKRDSSGRSTRAASEGRSTTESDRTGGESPAAPADTSRPGAGPRMATGDLPVAEIGGGAAAGAIVGRLIGGGAKGAVLGAAVGAAAGTALGLATGGVLRRLGNDAEVSREPAFGPAPSARPGREAPGAAAQAPGGTAPEGRRTAEVEERTKAEPPTRSEPSSKVEPPTRPEPSSKAEPPSRADIQAEATAAAMGEKPSDEPPENYEGWTKAELYDEARRRDIAGRSGMDKAELIRALRQS